MQGDKHHSERACDGIRFTTKHQPKRNSRHTVVVALGSLALLTACGDKAASEGAAPAEGAAAAEATKGGKAPKAAAATIPPMTPLPPEAARLLAGGQSENYRLSTAVNPAFKILDIPTGGTLPSAVATAMRHQPGFKPHVSEVGLGVEGLPFDTKLGRLVFLMSDKESLMFGTAGVPGQERVYQVHRYVDVSAAPITLAQFKADLTARFGNYAYQPGAFSSRGYQMYWGWLPDGAPVPPRGMNTGGMKGRYPDGVTYSWYLDNCLSMGGLNMSATGFKFVAAFNWPSKCAIQIGVNWMTSEANPDLVTKYLITIHDPQTAAQVQQELQARVTSAAANQKAQELQGASGRRATF